MSLTALVPILLLINLALAVLGVDYYQPYSVKNHTCLKNQDKAFAIIRAKRSNGKLDTNTSVNLINAAKAGLQTNIYMFPCRGKNATHQVYNLINSLKKVDSLYNTVWVDIQITSNPVCSWMFYDSSTNCQFILEIVAAIQKKGKKAGIYTNANYWQEILGNVKACTEVGRLPLWYAHFDNKPNFNSFKSFGGWKAPHMKQYAQNVKSCSINADLNYRQ